MVKMKGGLIKKDNIAAYNKFLKSGIPIDKSEHPDLYKQEFTALIHFLLPVVSPNETISLYYSSKLNSKTP